MLRSGLWGVSGTVGLFYLLLVLGSRVDVKKEGGDKGAVVGL